MLKSSFYYFFKYYLKIYDYLYFRDIQIYGSENIPKDGGVLFSPNHHCAFLDPVIVGSFTSGKLTSLTRSDVFGGPCQWFLDALEMLPVYRIRNGYSSLKKNEEIFEKCYQKLSTGKNILMFSEGGLINSEYYLDKISKGSSRLVFNAQKKTNKNIYIVPMGINYGDHKKPRCTLHLVFGMPIKIKEYLVKENTDVENINNLRAVLQQKMEDCLWLPKNNEQYFDKKKLITKKNTKLDFKSLKSLLEKDQPIIKNEKKKNKLNKLLVFILSLPNLIPHWISSKIVQLIKDEDFISSMKYASGATVFPLWWLLSSLLIVRFHTIEIMIFYLIICFISIIIRQKLKL